MTLEIWKERKIIKRDIKIGGGGEETAETWMRNESKEVKSNNQGKAIGRMNYYDHFESEK